MGLPKGYKFSDNILDMIKKGRYNGGCTSESAKRSCETRRKNGTIYRGGWSEEARLRSIEVRKRNKF